jgi:hypothetical protein
MQRLRHFLANTDWKFILALIVFFVGLLVVTRMG